MECYFSFQVIKSTNKGGQASTALPTHNPTPPHHLRWSAWDRWLPHKTVRVDWIPYSPAKDAPFFCSILFPLWSAFIWSPLDPLLQPGMAPRSISIISLSIYRCPQSHMDHQTQKHRPALGKPPNYFVSHQTMRIFKCLSPWLIFSETKLGNLHTGSVSNTTTAISWFFLYTSLQAVKDPKWITLRRWSYSSAGAV